jgi:hypothetical protein
MGQSEVRVRLALDGAFSALEVSGDTEGLLGFAAEEIQSGRVSLPDRIHPDDSGIAQDLFSPEMRAAGSSNLRLRMRHAFRPLDHVLDTIDRLHNLRDALLQKLEAYQRESKRQDRKPSPHRSYPCLTPSGWVVENAT